jgi:hypothetical protein
MRRPLYFFPDHEPFFGAVPVPHPLPKTSFLLPNVAKMLRELIVAFASPNSRCLDNPSVQAFYKMNAEVDEHPFFWCWYVDEHHEYLKSAGVISEELLLPLEVTAYRSWEYDDDIPMLLTRLRMHLKTQRFLHTAEQHDFHILDYNLRRHETMEVVVQRPKQLAGRAKALAKGLQVLDVDDHLGVDCAICADQLVIDEDDRYHGPVMTDCEHVFGHDCIVKWLYKHDTCPMCRRKLV